MVLMEDVDIVNSTIVVDMYIHMCLDYSEFELLTDSPAFGL